MTGGAQRRVQASQPSLEGDSGARIAVLDEPHVTEHRDCETSSQWW